MGNLTGRGLMPALKQPSESRGLIAMVLLAAMCIGGFYATSLAWGQHTHYSMIEYWRWWLAHLWVEALFLALFIFRLFIGGRERA